MKDTRHPRSSSAGNPSPRRKGVRGKGPEGAGKDGPAAGEVVVVFRPESWPQVPAVAGAPGLYSEVSGAVRGRPPSARGAPPAPRGMAGLGPSPRASDASKVFPPLPRGARLGGTRGDPCYRDERNDDQHRDGAHTCLRLD